MRLNDDSLTDTGRHRARNEDALHCDPQQRFYILADGMGGHPAGDVASRLAVASLARLLDERLPQPATELPSLIECAIDATNLELAQAAAENPAWQRMGTTLVLLLIQEQQAFFANVGDSRGYLLRGGKLQQCSHDHNLASAAPAGQTSGLANILTQALGLDLSIDVFQQQRTLQAGDRLLLCSDGLTNMLSDAEICRLLDPGNGTPQQVCRQLVDRANAAGGYDNISVILVDVVA